jgi:hypothetical protein
MRFLPAFDVQRTPSRNGTTRSTYSLDEWLAYLNEFVYNGNGYVTTGVNQTQPGQRQEPIGPAYRSLTDLAYKSDSVVFACMQTRARHFRQVRFQFRNRTQRQAVRQRGPRRRSRLRGLERRPRTC